MLARCEWRQQAGRAVGVVLGTRSDVSRLGGTVGVVLGTGSDVNCIRSDVSGINGCGFVFNGVLRLCEFNFFCRVW